MYSILKMMETTAVLQQTAEEFQLPLEELKFMVNAMYVQLGCTYYSCLHTKLLCIVCVCILSCQNGKTFTALV